MNATRYLNVMLTVIAVLLLAIVVLLLRPRGFGLALEQSAYAQSAPATPPDSLEFHPWINPRRFVFFDRSKGEIYIYDDDGELDAVWVVGKMGDDLKEKKR